MNDNKRVDASPIQQLLDAWKTLREITAILRRRS